MFHYYRQAVPEEQNTNTMCIEIATFVQVIDQVCM
jgi:hypothetical protein